LLSTPSEEVFLASDEPYQYLAGRLISQELVDVTECPASGLMSNGYADACGLSKAKSVVDSVAKPIRHSNLKRCPETGLPAQLLKNLFAVREPVLAGRLPSGPGIWFGTDYRSGRRYPLVVE